MDDAISASFASGPHGRALRPFKRARSLRPHDAVQPNRRDHAGNPSEADRTKHTTDPAPTLTDLPNDTLRKIGMLTSESVQGKHPMHALHDTISLASAASNLMSSDELQSLRIEAIATAMNTMRSGGQPKDADYNPDGRLAVSNKIISYEIFSKLRDKIPTLRSYQLAPLKAITLQLRHVEGAKKMDGFRAISETTATLPNHELEEQLHTLIQQTACLPRPSRTGVTIGQARRIMSKPASCVATSPYAPYGRVVAPPLVDDHALVSRLKSKAQGALFATLMTQLRYVPRSELTSALRCHLEMIFRLPIEHRAHAVERAVSSLYEFRPYSTDQTDQHEAYAVLVEFARAHLLPVQRAPVLLRLCKVVQWFAADQRGMAYSGIIGDLPPLPLNGRKHVYHEIIGQIEFLPHSDVCDLYQDLSSAVFHDPEIGNLATVLEFMFEPIRALPDRQQWGHIHALVNVVAKTQVAETLSRVAATFANNVHKYAAEAQTASFQAARSLANNLLPPEMRRPVLENLISNLDNFHIEPVNEFENIVNDARALPSEDHKLLLEAATEAINAIGDETHLHAAVRRVLDSIKLLAPDDRVQALSYMVRYAVLLADSGYDAEILALATPAKASNAFLVVDAFCKGIQDLEPAAQTERVESLVAFAVRAKPGAVRHYAPAILYGCESTSRAAAANASKMRALLPALAPSDRAEFHATLVRRLPDVVENSDRRKLFSELACDVGLLNSPDAPAAFTVLRHHIRFLSPAHHDAATTLLDNVSAAIPRHNTRASAARQTAGAKQSPKRLREDAPPQTRYDLRPRATAADPA